MDETTRENQIFRPKKIFEMRSQPRKNCLVSLYAFDLISILFNSFRNSFTILILFLTPIQGFEKKQTFIRV